MMEVNHIYKRALVNHKPFYMTTQHDPWKGVQKKAYEQLWSAAAKVLQRDKKTAAAQYGFRALGKVAPKYMGKYYNQKVRTFKFIF